MLPYAAKAGGVLVFLAALLHILDRQIEFTSRTDFLWKDKLKFEQEEVETMRGINKVCLKIFIKMYLSRTYLCVCFVCYLTLIRMSYYYTCTQCLVFFEWQLRIFGFSKNFKVATNVKLILGVINECLATNFKFPANVNATNVNPTTDCENLLRIFFYRSC